MEPLLPKLERMERPPITTSISPTSSIPEIISFLKFTFPYPNFTLAQQMLEKRDLLLKTHSLEMKDSLKKCERHVAQLEEDKRLLFDKNLRAEERHNKMIKDQEKDYEEKTHILLARIDELKNQKSEVEENLRVSEEKFSQLNGRVSCLEEEIGGLLDVDVDVIRKKALDMGIVTADWGMASQHNVLQSEVIFKTSSQAKDGVIDGLKSVCNSTGNSYKGIDNINLLPTEKSCPGDQIFQCGPSTCDYAQVDSNYSNKKKDRDHFEEAEPTRLACEAGDCIKNKLNAISDKPESSPFILIIEDDDDEMAYASKSSGLGGNLTCPQMREVCAEDSSSLAPKRKRSMSENENNDSSSFGRQKRIPIQEIVNDVKENSVFLSPCEGKIGSKYHFHPPPRRSDKPNGLNNGNDSDSDTDSCSTKNLDMCITRIKESRKWLSELDLRSAFELDPELCLNAVCALYRRQISENDSFKAGSQIDDKSIAVLGRYLTGRDHKLKRTASGVDSKYLEMCKTLAIRYCSQLFQLYHSKEDHLFCPGAAFSKL